MVKILESRLNIGQDDSIDELLAFEGIESCMENCDKKGLKAMREHRDAHEAEKAGFAKELHELRARADTSTRNAGGGKKPPPAYEGKRFPKALPPQAKCWTRSNLIPFSLPAPGSPRNDFMADGACSGPAKRKVTAHRGTSTATRVVSGFCSARLGAIGLRALGKHAPSPGLCRAEVAQAAD